MKSTKNLLAVLFALLLFCSWLNAQQMNTSPEPVVPRLVNYSGKAKDAQEKVISGVAGATFAIYKDPDGGAALWVETQNIQADAKGNYTVQLGASNPNGLPLDLFTSGEARWLGTTINGGAEQPRVLLLSVPYALKAADADTVGGLPASAFALASQQVTQSKSMKATNTVSSKAMPSSTPNATVTGKGVLDYIPMWDTASDIVDSVMFQKSSQIGINTTTPAATLDVNGKSDVRDTLTLFPKGTDSTLAINGTAFKIDQTGKITFVSGQTFPGGSGTVTSVGLSAPSSDFTVTGSPITTSGTLGLNWSVAPTNANTASAIVKRDSTGSFSATNITATNVYATNPNGVAIQGTSTTSNGGDGIDGGTAAASFSGVYGYNYSGSGGYGVTGSGYTGVYGGGTSYGLYGIGGSYGLFAEGYWGATLESYNQAAGSGQNAGTGLQIYAGSGDPNSASSGGYGIWAVGGSGGAYGGPGGAFFGGFGGGNGDGVYAVPGDGYAGYFAGDVDINGTIYTGAKDFKIDHPLDPANKYLFHASVESSEMMNIYTGNVTTNDEGQATVQLPDWFEAVNIDFRYQLTVLGQFAQAIVANKIQNHAFTIRTNVPNVEVSWQVTGVRHDAFAKAHPLVVEKQKELRLRGFYIHPELYGAPREKQEEWARHPEGMKRINIPRPVGPPAPHKIPASVKETQATPRASARH